MVGHYACTLQRPTICTHAIKGNFTGPDDINLIVAKSTTLEIHKVGPDGLTSMVDTDIYGRVLSLKLMRIRGEDTDVLFVSTEAYHSFVLAFDTAQQKLVTRAKYNDVGRIGRPTETGQKTFIDPENRMIGLHLFEGIIKIIPMVQLNVLIHAVIHVILPLCETCGGKAKGIFCC